MNYLIHSTVEDVSALIRKILQEELAKIALAKDESEENESLIKIEDVVKILHVSKPTIFAWIRKKKIPCHRMGSRLYFKRSEIMKAMRNNSK